MMTPDLTSDLSEGEQILRIDGSPDRAVLDVHAAYDPGDPSIAALAAGGIEKFLAPYRATFPAAATTLARLSKHAFTVETKRWVRQVADHTYRLYLVLPCERHYVLFQGHGPLRRQEEGPWMQALPAFLLEVAGFVQAFGVCYRSTYPNCLDVALLAYPWGGESMPNFVRGKRRKELSAKLGDLDNVRIIANGQRLDWMIFFDDSASAGSPLWVMTHCEDEGRRADLFALREPHAAYDALVNHYISGRQEAFDFTPYAGESL